MPRALLGFIMEPAFRGTDTWRSAFSLGMVARGQSAVPAIPEPGNFIVVAKPHQFADANATWRPADEGAWGTRHLRAPSAWGTVMSAERSKEAAVFEEEDIHGRLFAGGIGDARHRLGVRAVMRFATTVETSDDVVIAGATWHVSAVREIWQDGDWGELSLSLVRWPGLMRRGAFGVAAV